MANIKTQTLKGFRDFLPETASAREFVVGKIKEVFRCFGFEPLETPALEYQEVLLGKYGEEGDKLMYSFETMGGDEVVLRYDQTIPLARVVAQYGPPAGRLPMPFKRYQIQPVWRGENPQKGRFREFLQCDADIVGSSSPLADAEVIVLAAEALRNLGFQKFKILVNDREAFSNLIKRQVIKADELLSVLRSLDKINKISREAVLDELVSKGFGPERATYIIQTIEQLPPSQKLTEIFDYLKKLGLDDSSFVFSPTLARGLNYYTGVIFEVEIDGYSAGSVAGGGRYDGLIGQYSGVDTPATGFSFGFDRLLEAMGQLKLLPTTSSSAKVLVTVFSPDLLGKSLKATSQLRSNNINTELWLDPKSKLDKQLKYADQKKIPYAAIIGPDEAAKGLVTLKDLATQTQETLTLEEALIRIKQRIKN